MRSEKPTEKIKFHTIYYPVDQLDVELAYRLVNHFWVYAGIEGQQDAFHVPGVWMQFSHLELDAPPHRPP